MTIIEWTLSIIAACAVISLTGSLLILWRLKPWNF